MHDRGLALQLRVAGFVAWVQRLIWEALPVVQIGWMVNARRQNLCEVRKGWEGGVVASSAIKGVEQQCNIMSAVREDSALLVCGIYNTKVGGKCRKRTTNGCMKKFWVYSTRGKQCTGSGKVNIFGEARDGECKGEGWGELRAWPSEFLLK